MSSQDRFKQLWEQLVAEGMDRNQAAAEAIRRFKAIASQNTTQQNTTIHENQNSTNVNSSPSVTPSTLVAPSTTSSDTLSPGVPTPPGVPSSNDTTELSPLSSSKMDSNGSGKSSELIKRPAPESIFQLPPAKTKKENDSSRVMSLSLEEVQKVYSQSQLSGEPKLLIRLIGTYFADELILNNSFVNNSVDLSKSTDIATKNNSGIDFQGLTEVYDIIQSSDDGTRNSLSSATQRMLDSLKTRLTGSPYLLTTPTSLRFVLIIFENPLLLEPPNTKITKKICRIISRLPSSSRNILIQWLVNVGVDKCRDYRK